MLQSTFVNPLAEKERVTKSADPCVLVIFGATGDLTARKLVPAIYNLAREGQLPAHFACVAFARRPKDHAVFREEMHRAVAEFSRVKPVDEDLWSSFEEHVFYHQSEFTSDEGYASLRSYLDELDNQLGTKGNRVFYLSTQPRFFPLIISKLSEHGMIYDPQTVHDRWSRVIIEKPFGHELESALELQNHIGQYLKEDQIYRIDHYLGKETVQNLLVFRFANGVFESLWNNHHVDHIQISVAEDIGIGTRGAFWENAGMLRDIVQNHLMQLLTLVAMEPPACLQADSIRDEKVKVLQSIRPMKVDEVDRFVVRGQYGRGYIHGDEVNEYREEGNVAPESVVETYVAMKLYVDNWRWAGVPFYIRSAKRLPKRVTEIAVTFKTAPGALFRDANTMSSEPNVLVIRIQPDEGISLKFNCKVPGLATLIQPVKMDFRYGSYFGSTPPEAYERLICDCMAGDTTLFARDDEVMESWRILLPIQERWRQVQPTNFPNYRAGTWGPEEADRLIQQDGRKWRLM